MIIRKVKRSVIDKEPYQLWNAFIDLLAMEQYEDLTEIQRKAHLCFWYDSEVQNGGHFQYFENQGTDLIQDTISSLIDLGAGCQANTLKSAAKQYLSRGRDSIETVKDFVEASFESEFEQYDSNYYQCSPSITDLLKDYLEENKDYFVHIEDTYSI